jgi:ABC-2 type transport system ATP-binding protein
VFVSSHDIDEVERLADWIGIINQGRLELAEPVTSLLARFRQVEIALDTDAQLPAQVPVTWLLPATAGRTVRFVDNAFNESDIGAAVRAHYPAALDITATPMSLRHIFITLARVFRLSE